MTLKLWLRDETKEFERRTALIPTHARKLLDLGVEVTVESSKDRIFPDSDYEGLGCKIAPSQSWKIAPKDQIILGLKEITDINHDFYHDHIYFAHVYKGQPDTQQVLGQYKRGKGRLFDLEFLVDENNRRVAAFGHWAGFVGAAISLDRYLQREISPDTTYPKLKSFENIDLFLSSINDKIKQLNRKPRVIIIGAKGRCGNGAHDVFKRFDIECSLWDYEETKKGGPFLEILEHDIFINTVLLTKKIAPFIDLTLMKDPKKLKVVGDVSCDPESDFNPVAIYNRHTSWEEAFLTVEGSSTEVLAVDNLPSILPKESSEDFSEQLIGHLENLHTQEQLPEVFLNALRVFNEKLTLV